MIYEKVAQGFQGNGMVSSARIRDRPHGYGLVGEITMSVSDGP